MKKSIFLIVFTFISFIGLLLPAYGQLITESEARLKTESRKKEGFFSGQKQKGKSVSGLELLDTRKTKVRTAPPVTGESVQRQGMARTASGTPYKVSKGVQPRYTPDGGAGRATAKASAPRYSPGMPFAQGRRVQPRYSPGSPFSASDKRVATRYSPPKPFERKDFKVDTRYSIPPSGVVTLKTPPRYSPGMPFTAADYRVAPRYSQGNAYGGVVKLKTAPRYSEGMPFTARDMRVAPRYSQGNPYGGVVKAPTPRYSPGIPFKPGDYDISPRFSVGENSLKNMQKGDYMAIYKGPVDIRQSYNRKMHPSSAYLKAQNASSSLVVEAKRSWSIKWNRMTRGNKEQPGAVTDKVAKPKFDRKEREIWNN